MLNTDGYYNGVIQQLERALKEGMLRKHWSEYVDVVETPADAVAWCLRQRRGRAKPAPATPRSTDDYRRGVVHGAIIAGLAALGLAAVLRRGR